MFECITTMIEVMHRMNLHLWSMKQLGTKELCFWVCARLNHNLKSFFFFKTVRISEEHTQTFRLTKIDKFSFMELNSHSLRYALAAHGFIPLSLLFGCSQEMGVSNYLF